VLCPVVFMGGAGEAERPVEQRVGARSPASDGFFAVGHCSSTATAFTHTFFGLFAQRILTADSYRPPASSISSQG
jgi:hypothetical protein